jgi:hypothetical protein
VVPSIDTSRAPRGELTAAELVAAIAAGDDRLERHYLEVKGPLDFTTKPDTEKLAKFILGAANRMPDLASTAFEGYGVMVIGVNDEGAVGVPPVEMMQLSKRVKPFLGAGGPRWDIIRVPVVDSPNEVLVLLVDPPEPGQDPFPCRKSGISLTDGRIYTRVEGESREATADEVDLLLKRGKQATAVAANFEVTVIGAAYRLAYDNSQTLEKYVNAKRSALLDALPKPKPPTPPVRSGSGLRISDLIGSSGLSNLDAIANVASSMYDPETRTEDEYRDQVENWAAAFRDQWGRAVEELSGYGLKAVQLKVSNRETTYFQAVEVNVHLEGEVRGVAFRESKHWPSIRDLDLPTPPRKWGPRERSFLISPSILAGLNPSEHVAHFSRVNWTNGGSVDLSVPVGDLRPRGTFTMDEDELVLIVSDSGMENVKGTWSLTASGHDRIFEGTLEVGVMPVDLTAGLLRTLNLEPDEES